MSDHDIEFLRMGHRTYLVYGGSRTFEDYVAAVQLLDYEAIEANQYPDMPDRIWRLAVAENDLFRLDRCGAWANDGG